jgi:hypothetical protein
MPTTPPSSEIRAWARARGIAVSGRGRIPADVMAAWEAARHDTAPGRSAEAPTPAFDAAEDRLAALEELLTVADERLHALEDHVDALTVRMAELEGKRRRATILLRRAGRV